jgi:uncharacterized protein with HEPN domain
MTRGRSVSDHLNDIRDALEKILQFTEATSFSEFASDSKCEYAVVRAF